MPTVTAGSLRTEIQSLGGDTGKTFITDLDAYAWIMAACGQISKIAECLTSTQTISAVANTEMYSLNDVLIRPTRVTYENRKLKVVTEQHIDMIDPDRDISGNNGQPRLCWFDGGQIGLYPKPSAASANAIIIRGRILASAVLNDDNDVIQIPDYFREDIIRYAMLKLREKDEQPEVMQALWQDWQFKIAISKDLSTTPEGDSYPVVRDVESAWDYGNDGYW